MRWWGRFLPLILLTLAVLLSAQSRSPSAQNLIQPRPSHSEKPQPNGTVVNAAQRRPQPGLIHHSDRGSQYACGEYQQQLAKHGLRGSMSRRGDCWATRLPKVSLPASSSNSFTRFNGELVPRYARRFLNISSCSITAIADIRRSAT
jgi:hypothetical protein